MDMIRTVKNHRLYFDGCDTVKLAQKYQTPLYVFSENAIVSELDRLKCDFIDKYENTRVAYAAKAFCTLAMCQLIAREGMCIDVVSGGELFTALQAGIKPECIEFNGNNKSYEELLMAVEAKIGRIIVDGLTELDILEQICSRTQTHMRVLFRITPGVQSDSHDYIVTGKKDSKFGIPLDEEILYPLLKKAKSSQWLEFMGFHFHVGSQLFTNDAHLQALDIVLALTQKVECECGLSVQELNLGGGFGITYTDEKRQPYGYFLDPMMERIALFYKDRQKARPAIVIEPGRSIVGEAGITLYTIGMIKDIPKIRKYVSVDGGMTDNIRPALYHAVYDGVIAGKADAPKTETVTICGKCCESGDILIKDLKCSHVAEGDVLAVFSTGAYGYSMASNYNKHPVPAVVFVKDGKDRLIVKRQTYAQMNMNELGLSE